MDINQAFANRRNKDKIYPLTVSEIAEEQIKDKALQQQKIILGEDHQLMELDTVF